MKKEKGTLFGMNVYSNESIQEGAPVLAKEKRAGIHNEVEGGLGVGR